MKAFFLSRLSREKILLLVFVALAACLWFTRVGRRASAFVQEYNETSIVLLKQKIALDSSAAIKAREQAAIQQLDPSRTFDAVRLQAELDTIASVAGITNKTIGDAHVEKSAQFAVNSAQITLSNVEYATFVKFYEELKKRSPYIGMEQVTIQASAANSSQLRVTLKVSAVEIVR